MRMSFGGGGDDDRRPKVDLKALQAELGVLVKEVEGLEAQLLDMDPGDPRIPGIKGLISKKKERMVAIRSQL